MARTSCAPIGVADRMRTGRTLKIVLAFGISVARLTSLAAMRSRNFSPAARADVGTTSSVSSTLSVASP